METKTYRFLKCPVCTWVSKKPILDDWNPNLKRCFCPECHKKKLEVNPIISNIDVAKCEICGTDSTETTIRTLDQKPMCERCIKRHFG